jgi:hypothetical protein
VLLLPGKNMTPLQHAVYAGNLPAVRYLLDKGADVHLASHLKGQEGITALHTAADKGIFIDQHNFTSFNFSPCDYLQLSRLFLLCALCWSLFSCTIVSAYIASQ